MAFLIAGALIGCVSPDSAAQAAASTASPKLPVDALTLQEETLEDRAEYLAELVSRHQVAVYSQVVGNVSAILVQPGDAVKAGAPLIQIDPRRETANRDNLLAARAEKEASLILARTTAERSKRLLDEGLLSQQQYDQDRNLREVAEQALKAEQAALAAQGAQLAYYRISAPFAGVVGDIPVKLGDLVSPTMKLTSVADNTRLEAYVNIPVDKLSLLTEGSVIQILDAGHQVTVKAPVTFVASEANPALQSVLIKAVIPNTTSLRASQLVRARVVFRAHSGLRVPMSAVVRQSGQYFVFVLDKAGAQALARQRAVELGELDDDRYEVRTGLAPGDRVIVTQLQKLKDGAKVETRAPPASVGSVPLAPLNSASP